ncbi:hypothetical protein E2C01_062373 [Portunus trituberculatus]|uniref:Uncharacterized protein n=1 Tax=Portunus trituberculatus TaxID=210409 RepID=A0A5B7HDV6_PORTR|nr:hypothetical protein [Portunus trituberculatus]
MVMGGPQVRAAARVGNMSFSQHYLESKSTVREVRPSMPCEK